MTFEDVINMHLQEAAEELRQEELDARYEEFLNEMYALWELEMEQYDQDMEFFNEFG